MLIVNTLKEAYSDKDRPPRPKKTISPTRLLKCQRGAFFEMLGYSEPVTLETKLTKFDYGTWRHDEIQAILLHNGLLMPNPDAVKDRSPAEYKMWWDDPPMFGYCDGILGENDAVLEIKTTSDKAVTTIGPKPDHIDQILLYMHMAGIKRGIILYELKDFDKEPWFTFDVDYDEERIEMLLNRGRTLLRYLESGVIPMKDPRCFVCRNPACSSRKIQKEAGLS